MKVWLATSGEYSDYRVVHAFAREDDAEAYELGDNVEEFEVHKGPVEVRAWHRLTWRADMPDREGDSMHASNPHEVSDRRDFDGHLKHVEHRWAKEYGGTVDMLYVQGGDIDRVRKVYSEQRAQYIARKDMGVRPAPGTAR